MPPREGDQVLDAWQRFYWIAASSARASRSGAARAAALCRPLWPSNGVAL